MRLIWLFCILILVIIPFSSAVLVQENFTSGSDTWIVPEGVTQIKVKMLSSGGNGGTGSNAQCCGSTPAGPGGAGGGGAGSYAEKNISVSQGQSYLINVGDQNNPVSFSGGTTLLLINPGSTGQDGGILRGDGGGAGGNGGVIINPNQFDFTSIGGRGSDGGGGYRAHCLTGQYAFAGNGGSGGNSVSASGGSSGEFVCYPTSIGIGGNGTLGSGGGGGSGYNGAGGNGGIGYVIIEYYTSEPVVQLPSNLCLNENQTILSLYTSNNSHAALWNNESANYKICYEDLFPSAYTGNNPHVCTGTNTVLKLSSAENAHVAEPSNTSYSFSACFGNLECSVRYANCLSGETAIARLSNTTNAHISNSSFMAYQYPVCCKGTQADIFNSVRWEQSGQVIGTSKLHQTVDLVANTNLSNGTKITFEIYERDSNANDSIRTGANNLTAIVDGNGKAKINWYINDSDIDAGSNGCFFGLGDEDCGSSDPNVEFFFIAKYGTKEIISGDLITSKIAGVLNPNSCEVEITGVTNGGIYFANTSLIISQTMAGASKYSWSVAETGFTSNSPSINLSLNSVGQNTINLIVEIPGCANQVRQIGILVVGSGAGEYLFVSKPFASQIILTRNSSSVGVDYSAEGSYVLEASSIGTCNPVLNCLAGTCPALSSGAPYGCVNNVSISNPNQNYNLINFTWSEINRNGEKPAFSSGFGESIGTKELYSSSYSKNIDDFAFKVKANYTSGSYSLSKSFVRNFTLGECLIKGNGSASYLVQTSGVLNKILEANNYSTSLKNYDPQACKGLDELYGTKDDCCPKNYMCSENQGCVPKSPSAPTRCEDYGTQALCQNDTYGLWRYQESSQANYCSNTADSLQVNCAWNNTLGCTLKTTVRSSNGADSGSCFEQAQNITACVNGYYQINVTAIPQGSVSGSCLECKSGVYPAPCGRPAFELPFFNIYQFVIVLVIILVIYIIIRKIR